MSMLWKALLVILALVGLAVGALFVTGNGALLGFGWAFLFGGPSAPFDPAAAAPAPDYGDRVNWAALPDREGLEDMVPAGVTGTVTQGDAPVDVFFIHPTGYLKGDSWTFSMDPNTATEENTRWMLANQASAYNGCCNVYAPRYRQANIFAYLRGEAIRDEVLAFAYEDVARAFEHFLNQFSNGRPFVIASHSQGTHHGARLLAEQIDGTPLAERLVAAYLIGGGLARAELETMADIALCTTADDLHCAVHWDTYSEAVIDDGFPDLRGNVCVNPLSWELDGGLAGRDQHLGAVPVSGRFQIELNGPDVPAGINFEPLAAPQPRTLEAQCRDGVLFITDQEQHALRRHGRLRRRQLPRSRLSGLPHGHPRQRAATGSRLPRSLRRAGKRSGSASQRALSRPLGARR